MVTLQHFFFEYKKSPPAFWQEGLKQTSYIHIISAQ